MALAPDWYLRERLKFRHLKFLVALGDVEHQAQAAEMLSITQPGASKMLAELESMLQTRLFDRTAKGTVPTPAGEVLIQHARWILGDLERIGGELERVGAPLNGEVYLGTNSSSAAYLVPKSLLLLQQSAPAITVVVREESAESLLPSLETRKLDLVVARLGRVTGGRNYSHTVLFDEPMVLVTDPSHPLVRRQAPILWKDLAAFPWILPPRASPVYQGLETLFTQHAIKPPVIAESASILNNTMLLEAASAISIMPASVARRYTTRGQLKILPLELPRVFGPIAIVTLRDVPLSPAVAEVVRCLQSVAQELAPSVA